MSTTIPGTISPNEPQIPLDNKLGAAFLGNLMAAILYGVTSIQTYIYFTRKNQKDQKWLRGLVFFLWILDAAHLALVTHGLYYCLVTNYGILTALLSPPWSLNAQVYVTVLSDLIVRSLFGRRVWFLTRKNYLLIVFIAMASLTEFVSGVAFATRAYQVKTFANFHRIAPFLYIGFTAAVAADILIAGSLCYTLWIQRTGFKKTDALITVLIKYTVNTCLLTTICYVAALITYLVWPNEFTYIAIYFTLSKLFLNSLLAMLNSRETLSEGPSLSDSTIWNFPSSEGQASTQDRPRSVKFDPSLLIRADHEATTLS